MCVCVCVQANGTLTRTVFQTREGFADVDVKRARFDCICIYGNPGSVVSVPDQVAQIVLIAVRILRGKKRGVEQVMSLPAYRMKRNGCHTSDLTVNGRWDAGQGSRELKVDVMDHVILQSTHLLSFKF